MSTILGHFLQFSSIYIVPALPLILKRKWNNCFIKNNQEILLDLTDFAVQEQPEDNLMVAISRSWYNGSY